MIDPADIELIYQHVDFSPLVGKRVLITGGTGFVGRWMQIVPRSISVTALNHAQYQAGEWEDQEWDYIIHLAPDSLARVLTCNAQARARILYASSGAVFDREPGEYAWSKIIGEQMLLKSGCDGVIARMFAFAGPYLRNRFALTNMIHDGLDGDRIRIRSTKTSVTRSYLYAADMAVWMWNILLHGQTRGIYEVGSTRAVTMEQLAREVQKHLPAPVYHEPMMTQEPRPHYLPTKAQATMAELGVREYTSFEDAIKKTVDYFRQEQEQL